jgi:hypothetical protein
MRQAIAMFVLYGLGSLSLIYVVVYYMKDTDYFLEENVVLPIHLQLEKTLVIGSHGAPTDTTEGMRSRSNATTMTPVNIQYGEGLFVMCTS